MRFFKNFFQFQRFGKLLEQNQDDQIIGGKKEFEIAAKGKNKLPYTKKATENIWKGDNYENIWKPKVAQALEDQKIYDEVVKYLTSYNGQGKNVVKKLIEDSKTAPGPGDADYKLKYLIGKLATDGKIGPFHTLMNKAINTAIEKVKPKETKLQTTNTNPEPEPVVKKVVKKKKKKKEVQEDDNDTEENFDDDEIKSETSDQTTGRMGEQEKRQLRYSAKGTGFKRLMSLQYPSIQGDYVKLGKLEIKETGAGKVNIKVSLSEEFGKSSKNLGKERYVYFFSDRSPFKGFEIQCYSTILDQPELVFDVYPTDKEEYKVKMIISSENLNLKTTVKKNKKNGQVFRVMSPTDADMFVTNLLKRRKPFSKNDWNGPTFQVFDGSIKLN